MFYARVSSYSFINSSAVNSLPSTLYNTGLPSGYSFYKSEGVIALI